MNGKYLGVVIGAVVAIMLVGGVLMPIINEQATTTDETTVEGISPLKYAYSTAYNSEFQKIVCSLSDGVLTITQGDTVQTLSVSSDDVIPIAVVYGVVPQYSEGDGVSNVKISVFYNDSHIMVYWPDGSNNTYTASYPLNIQKSPFDESGTVLNIQANGGIDLDITSIQYLVVPDATSEYEFYKSEYPGDENNIITSIELESPTQTTWYLGPIATVGNAVSSPYSAIYLAIPIVILVALLTAVAFVAFRRDY